MARVSALLCALALSLSPAMGAAQDEQGKSLMERGAEMFLDGLRQEMEPKFEELLGMAELVFVGGQDTVASQFGYAMQRLAERPDLQQRLKDVEAQAIIDQIRHEMADFLEVRPLLTDMLAFIERKSSEDEVRTAAEVLSARLKNLRFGA